MVGFCVLYLCIHLLVVVFSLNVFRANVLPLLTSVDAIVVGVDNLVETTGKKKLLVESSWINWTCQSAMDEEITYMSKKNELAKTVATKTELRLNKVL